MLKQFEAKPTDSGELDAITLTITGTRPSNTPTTTGSGADNKKRDREGIIDHEYSHMSSTLLRIGRALDCL